MFEEFEGIEPKKQRCEGCKHCKIVRANGGFSFYGCFCKPYKGEWVAQIKDCPLNVIGEQE